MTQFSLLLLRVGLSALILTHGIPKLKLLFGGTPIEFIEIMGMPPVVTLSLAVFAEVFCAILVLLGLMTRYATIPLIILLVIAAFVIHSQDPFGKQELPLLYLLGYVTLLLNGGGKYSFDQLIRGKKRMLR